MNYDIYPVLSLETIVLKFWMVRPRWYASALPTFLENSESEQIHSCRNMIFIGSLPPFLIYQGGKWLHVIMKTLLSYPVYGRPWQSNKIIFVDCLNGHNKSICIYEFSKLRNFSYWGPDRMMQNQMFILLLNNWTILNWISKS